MAIFYTDSASFNDISVTGSLIVSGGLTLTSNQPFNITGSLFGTASRAQSASVAISSSFAISASWAPTQAVGGVSSITAGDGLTGGTITSTGTITLDTSSVHFLDGVKKELNTEGVISSSNQFTNLNAPFTGSFTGSFRGSLIGTSSWANNVVSASFASTASFVNILNQNVSASGNIEAGNNLRSNFSSGDEGGEINLARPQTNTGISGSVVIDVNGNRVRIFEADLPNRGGYWDITSLASGV